MTKEIAEKLGVELEALQGAFDGYKVMSNEDFDTLKTNLSTETEGLKEKYQLEGQKVGKEILLKELKKQLNLEYEGRKSPENFVNAINEKFANANSEEYAAKIKEVNASKQTLQEEFEAFKVEVKNQEEKRFVNDSLSKEFNQYNGKTSIDINDLMTLYKSKNSVKFDGESLKIYQGDQLLKDDTLQPVSVSESVKSFVEGSYLSNPTAKGGRGEGDSTEPTGKMSHERFEERLKKQGLSPNSSEFMTEINNAYKSGLIG